MCGNSSTNPARLRPAGTICRARICDNGFVVVAVGLAVKKADIAVAATDLGGKMGIHLTADIGTVKPLNKEDNTYGEHVCLEARP